MWALCRSGLSRPNDVVVHISDHNHDDDDDDDDDCLETPLLTLGDINLRLAGDFEANLRVRSKLADWQSNLKLVEQSRPMTSIRPSGPPQTGRQTCEGASSYHSQVAEYFHFALESRSSRLIMVVCSLLAAYLRSVGAIMSGGWPFWQQRRRRRCWRWRCFQFTWRTHDSRDSANVHDGC